MDISNNDTAVLITDPQNDFLSEQGVIWGLVGESVKANGTIANIDEIAKSASMQGPSMIIIGEVVKLRDRLRWFSEQDKASFAMGLGAKEAL